MAPPFKQAVVDIIFGVGISKEYDLLDAALEYNIVKQSGAWFAFGAEKIGQGREAVAANLKGNAALFDAVKQQVLAAMSKEVKESSKQDASV
jgi:recombination protein RecA